MRESRVGIGVIGLGGISSSVHLPGLRLCPYAEIVALCDNNTDLLRQRAEEYSVPTTTTSYQELVQLPSVDAVIVATPTVLHAPIALAAMRAGKHVLVEKQLAMDYAEALRMLDAANEAKVGHMVAFTYRFVPGMRYLRHLLAQGQIGLPRHIRVARLQDWPEEDLGWRQHRTLSGSGEVGDMGAHRIDFCHDLFGPISRVIGVTRTFVPERRGLNGGPAVPTDVEDFSTFIAEFAPGVGAEQGLVASFELSKVTKGRQFGAKGLDELAVYGVDGTLVYHLDTPHEIQIGRPDQPMETVAVPEEFLTYPGSPRDPHSGDPGVTFRYDQAFAFVQSIVDGRMPVPSFYDGARCQAVVDAVLESAASRNWVDVADVPTVKGPIAAAVADEPR